MILLIISSLVFLVTIYLLKKNSVSEKVKKIIEDYLQDKRE